MSNKLSRRLTLFGGPAAALVFALPIMAQMESSGAVYTATNEASGNRVMAYPRAADGSLGPGAPFMTGGNGTGGGLGSQGALILSPDQQFLFVVDAGSNTITSFQVLANGLRKLVTVESGGVKPISLTMHDNLLYVLNAGSDSIQGFVVGRQGLLSALPGSAASLSGAGVDPAQISFNTQGNVLIVTEKATNSITTFRLGPNGRPGKAMVTPASGQTPFGFAVGQRNRILVSEAFGGAPGASTLSSYNVSADGMVTPTNTAATTQTSACWVALVEGGNYALTANTGSGTVSSLRVGFDGTVALSHATAGTTGGTSIDIAVTNNQRYAYVLSNSIGTITGFAVRLDGSLEQIGHVSELPTSTGGLAAR